MINKQRRTSTGLLILLLLFKGAMCKNVEDLLTEMQNDTITMFSVVYKELTK